ncbi:unnamed protein product [Spirodela intermedia]|uniref:Uncharacterized protein n=1 Tax=Spirodela intermedia TaxID=51605 RepID=A0A7I8J8H7_SPIIN|nr:unnamed protein product [Spirodela intermedia]CAA6666518.1 unnamed protein product [Spirodela intermedia]
MASQYEVEVTVISGKNMKNVNWRNGNLHPYVVLWLDPAAKRSTKVASTGKKAPARTPSGTRSSPSRCPPAGASPPAAPPFHRRRPRQRRQGHQAARRLRHRPLAEIVDEVGIGGKASRTLKLKRPSGRPQGKLEVKIAVREPFRYYDSPPPPAPGYGAYAPPAYGHQYRDYGGAPAPYGYGAPPPSGCPSYGYPYGAAPPPAGVWPAIGVWAAAVRRRRRGEEEQVRDGDGAGGGGGGRRAGGAGAGGGADYVEDKIADDVAERVEDDLGFDDDGGDF